MLLRDKQLHVMSVFVGLLPITKERDKGLKERERERARDGLTLLLIPKEIER